MEKNNGEVMKFLREKHGVSQKEIIQKLNVSQSTYSNYENGRGNPPKDVIEKLCEILNESVDNFEITVDDHCSFKLMNYDFNALKHLITLVDDKRLKKKFIFEFDDLIEEFKERIKYEIEHGEK